MDFGIAFGYQRLPEDESKFSDIETGFKFAFIPDLFSASFSGALGSKTYGLSFILSRMFGLAGPNANIGMQAQADTDDRNLTYAQCCHRDPDRFSFGVEAAGTHEDLELWQVWANFAITKRLTIDAGLNGNFDQTPVLKLTAGLTFAFSMKKVKGK
jgi:hypothetical protein